MAFVWKDHKDIFKGEGVYHLTFAVVGRRPLLGRLVPIADSPAYSRQYGRDVKRLDNTNGNTLPKHTATTATVQLTPLGFAISKHLKDLEQRLPGIVLCAKQIMPDHLHAVYWIKADPGKSIRQIGNGLRVGIKRLAIALGEWNEDAGHLMEIPFIRTLSHRRQLRSMIDYTHANPDNALLRRLNPDLYVIRRNMARAGLHFDTMGKTRLLDWPDRQVIALRRSLTEAEIEHEVNRALLRAKAGTVTYTAAINNGEKAVAKAIRTAGYPLVVMMLDGFPPEGSEAARYFHPSGVYHEACGRGQLCLMAPLSDNYLTPALIARTEAELQRKASEKGIRYYPIPHDSKRWRMIAGNMMLQMVAGLS